MKNALYFGNSEMTAGPEIAMKPWFILPIKVAEEFLTLAAETALFFTILTKDLNV